LIVDLTTPCAAQVVDAADIVRVVPPPAGSATALVPDSPSTFDSEILIPTEPAAAAESTSSAPAATDLTNTVTRPSTRSSNSRPTRPTHALARTTNKPSNHGTGSSGSVTTVSTAEPIREHINFNLDDSDVMILLQCFCK
jgi:hypothetical protein